jgi:hypothetical protein
MYVRIYICIYARCHFFSKKAREQGWQQRFMHILCVYVCVYLCMYKCMLPVDFSRTQPGQAAIAFVYACMLVAITNAHMRPSP